MDPPRRLVVVVATVVCEPELSVVAAVEGFVSPSPPPLQVHEQWSVGCTGSMWRWQALCHDAPPTKQLPSHHAWSKPLSARQVCKLVSM